MVVGSVFTGPWPLTSGRWFLYSVFRVNFMVKLLRACVWMPWRKKAMKDVASCDKPRGDASNL